MEIFLCISSVPAAHAEYSAANVISPVGAVAAVKRLLCHRSYPNSPPTFQRGAKISSPDRVNLGPRHISETITDGKLKFYAHLHRVKYTSEYEIFPLGRPRGQRPLV